MSAAQVRRPPDLRDAAVSLHQAKAALWLLDQLHVGELGFLDWGDGDLPCWESAAACREMKPREVKEWLRGMATETLAQALAEADGIVVGLRAQGERSNGRRPRAELEKGGAR